MTFVIKSVSLTDYLKLDPKFREIDISETSHMSCLIPAMQGDGLLCVALLDHLIGTHNCLIQLSRNFVEKTLERLDNPSSKIIIFNCMQGVVATHSKGPSDEF